MSKPEQCGRDFIEECSCKKERKEEPGVGRVSLKIVMWL
jgi:hypothetical protein